MNSEPRPQELKTLTNIICDTTLLKAEKIRNSSNTNKGKTLV